MSGEGAVAGAGNFDRHGESDGLGAGVGATVGAAAAAAGGGGGGGSDGGNSSSSSAHQEVAAQIPFQVTQVNL